MTIINLRTRGKTTIDLDDVVTFKIVHGGRFCRAGNCRKPEATESLCKRILNFFNSVPNKYKIVTHDELCWHNPTLNIVLVRNGAEYTEQVTAESNSQIEAYHKQFVKSLATNRNKPITSVRSNDESCDSDEHF